MDSELRRLERAARGAPDDRAAAWTFVRALGRAGERRRELAELCRLARGGDVDAGHAIAAASPWPRPHKVHGTRRARRAGLRAASDAIRITSAALPFGARLPELVATDTTAVLASEDGLAGLDTERLVLRWPADDPPRRPLEPRVTSYVRGAELLCVASELLARGAKLAVRSPETGERFEETVLPPLESAVAWGDVVIGRRADPDAGRPLVAFDAGDALGEVLWERVLPGWAFQAMAGGRLILVHRTGRLSALDVATGVSRWDSARSPVERRVSLLAADERDILVVESELDPRGSGTVARRRRMRLVDADAGVDRWSLPLGPILRDQPRVAMGADRLVWLRDDPLRQPAQSPLLVGVDRDDGSEAWRVELDPSVPGRSAALAVSDDVVTIAWHRRGWPLRETEAVLRILGFDLAGGDALFDVAERIGLEVDEQEPPSVIVVPLERALLALAAWPSATWVARLDAAAPES